ncbi:MucR family transcriptional regulator [Sphingomonas sp. ID0503]|uniref:MucR family transcriptional regulator n=1 Tax=Sphingomonas sp. ID0503 TaxID=3399691 RepID=UPI003AFAA148
MTEVNNEALLTLTADIVAAHVANNTVSVTDLPGLIEKVHGALTGLGAPAAPEPVEQQPAVPVRSSIKPDYLVSLESGKKMKMLKRYLMNSYGMTPAEYRAKWKLPADYPMVAPNYAAQRKELAHKIGLGRKPKVEEAPQPAAAPARRARKPKAEADAPAAAPTPAAAPAEAPKRRGRKPKAAAE